MKQKIVGRPKRRMTGKRSYETTRLDGTTLSRTEKVGNTTTTFLKNGSIRNTHNLGGGYASVYTSEPIEKKVRKKRTKKYKNSNDSNLKLGLFGKIIFAMFLFGVWIIYTNNK